MDPTLSLAYVLIGAGFLLMIAELFLPSGGVLSVLSAAGIIIGVVLAFSYRPQVGMWTLLGVIFALPFFIKALLHYWPKMPIGRQMFLQAPDANDTLAATPENVELEQLRGQIGRTLSALRPAGVAEFGGRRIDCMTEGSMVDKDKVVRCVDVRAGKVVVRPVERPDLTNLETAEFS